MENGRRFDSPVSKPDELQEIPDANIEPLVPEEDNGRKTDVIQETASDLDSIEAKDEQAIREYVFKFYKDRIVDNAPLFRLLIEQSCEQADISEKGIDQTKIDLLFESVYDQNTVKKIQELISRVQGKQKPLSVAGSELVQFLSGRIREKAPSVFKENRATGFAGMLKEARTVSAREEVMRKYITKAMGELVPGAMGWFQSKVRSEHKKGNTSASVDGLINGLAKRWAADPRENQYFAMTMNAVLADGDGAIDPGEADKLIIGEVVKRLEKLISLQTASENAQVEAARRRTG